MVLSRSRSSGLAKTILQGTVKGNRRRDEKTISKNGQEWTLPAQLRHPKSRHYGKGLLRMYL